MAINYPVSTDLMAVIMLKVFIDIDCTMIVSIVILTLIVKTITMKLADRIVIRKNIVVVSIGVASCSSKA